MPNKMRAVLTPWSIQASNVQTIESLQLRGIYDAVSAFAVLVTIGTAACCLWMASIAGGVSTFGFIGGVLLVGALSALTWITVRFRSQLVARTDFTKPSVWHLAYAAAQRTERFNELVRRWNAYLSAAEHPDIMDRSPDEADIERALVNLRRELEARLERVEIICELEALQALPDPSPEALQDSLEDLREAERALIAHLSTQTDRLLKGPLEIAKLEALDEDLARIRIPETRKATS